LCFTLLKLDNTHLQFEEAVEIFKKNIELYETY
jgi:hypothetical protein